MKNIYFFINYIYFENKIIRSIFHIYFINMKNRLNKFKAQNLT